VSAADEVVDVDALTREEFSDLRACALYLTT
jgi:hypothetical protein